MSEQRVSQHEMLRNSGETRIAYVEPTAEWHDLKVITLGGPSGTGDSGAEGVQLSPSRTHYDEASQDYDKYV